MAIILGTYPQYVYWRRPDYWFCYRNTYLNGDLSANGGMFSSDKIGSQFNLIVAGSDFTNTRQT